VVLKVVADSAMPVRKEQNMAANKEGTKKLKTTLFESMTPF